MASSMYRMKPLFDPYAKIEIKTDMYRMKNLHDHDARSDPVSTEIVSNGSAEDDDFVKFLEGRQEELLKRLDKLRQLLSEPIVTPGASPKKIPTSNQGSKMTVQAVDLVKVSPKVFHLFSQVFLQKRPGAQFGSLPFPALCNLAGIVRCDEFSPRRSFRTKLPFACGLKNRLIQWHSFVFLV